MPKLPSLKKTADGILSGASSAARLAADAAKDAADTMAKAGKAVAANEVVQDLVLDAVEFVAPRTAKRLEATMKPAEQTNVARKRAAEAIETTSTPAPSARAASKAAPAIKRNSATRKKPPNP